MRKLLLAFLVFISTGTLMAQNDYNWVPQSLSPDNNLLEMEVMDDNSLVVIGNYNSVFKSVDNGLTWDFLSLINPEYDLASMSISASGTGYISSRAAKLIDYSTITDPLLDGILFKTTDNGATWTAVDLSGISSTDAHLDPLKDGAFGMDIYAVGCKDDQNAFIYIGWKDVLSGTKISVGAVFETADGGATWAPITDDLGSYSIASFKNYGDTTYMGGNNKLYKYCNDVLVDMYPALVAANEDDNIFIYDIGFIAQEEFYVVTSIDGVFHTSDGGKTFTELKTGSVPTGGYSMYIMNSDTMMIVGTTSKTKVSLDGGANWTSCSAGSTCYTVGGIMNDSIVAGGRDNLYKLAVADLGIDPTKWTTLTVNNTSENILNIKIIDDNNAILCGNSGVFKSTQDKGLTWSDVAHAEFYDRVSTTPEYEVSYTGVCNSSGVSYIAARRYDHEDYSSFLTYYPGPIYMSLDNWVTWELMDIDEIGKENQDDASIYPFHDDCYGFDPYTIECIDDSIIFLWANWYDTIAGFDSKVSHSRIFKSVDNGDTWNSITDDMGGPFITDIHFVDKNTGYVGGSATLLKTTDGGASFTDLYPVMDVDEDDNMYVKAIVYVGPDEIYLPTVSDSVWLMSAGGTQFDAVPGLTGANDIIKLGERNLLTVGSTSKSFVTTNGAESWRACSPGVTIWSIGGVVNDSLYALTKGDIYKIAVTELASNVGIDEEVTEGDMIKLLNRLSEVEVMSLKDNIERCEVYSITGNLVEVQEPNSASCIINKTNYRRGVYIISTQIQGKRFSHKVVF